MSTNNSTKKQIAQTNRNTSSLAKASGIDLTKSLSALGSAGVTIQSTLGKIQEELITKHAELQAIEESIILKTEELEGLHSKDQILLSTDELKAQHQQTINELQQQKDKLIHENEELESQLAQERKREFEAFSYKLNQDRKAESDSWNEQLRVRFAQERDRKEAFEKDINSREFVLKTKENEYQVAISKAATFEAEVTKEVKKAEAILESRLTKDFKHATEITAVQNSAQLEKYRFDNQRLLEAANNYEIQVKELQAQLKTAYEENVKLARAAVEGAANKAAQSEALALMTSIGGGGNGQRPTRS